MAKPINKTKTIHEIEQEMQKIQQEVDARNAKIEALQQQKLQVVLEAKCTFFDVIYDAALKDATVANTLLGLTEKLTGERKKIIANFVTELRDSIKPMHQEAVNEPSPQGNETLTQAELEEREIERMLAEEEAQNAPVNSVQTQPQAS